MAGNPARLHAPHAADYLVLAIAQVAVGSAAILARWGLQGGLTPWSLAAWRLTLASALLVGGLRVAKRAHGERLDRRTMGELLAAGILLGLHFAAWFASLERISVARSTLLVATTPLWAGMGGLLFLREPPPRRFWLGLLISAAGTYLVTGTASNVHGQTSASGALAGDILAVLGAIAIAAYLLLVRPVQARIGSARLVAWTYSLAALTLWPVVLAASTLHPFTPSPLPQTRTAWWAVIGMALGPQLIGHTGLNWSLRRFTAAAVAASTLAEPVVAALLAWWVFREALTPIQGLGAVVLLVGVGLALRTTDNTQRTAVTAPQT